MSKSTDNEGMPREFETAINNINTKTFIKRTDVVFETCIEKDLDKLNQLENIEKELGINPITLLTALTQGYVFWKYDNFIYKVEVESITNCCLKVNTWFYANSNKNGKRYGDELSINFKDYGKNWTLTREELENDK